MANGIDFVINGKNNAGAAMGSVEQLLKRLTAAYVAFKGVALGVGKLNEVNAAFDAQAESVRKLNAALQIRGSQAMSGPMQQTAKDLEKLTGVSDNATLALMHQASGMGFAAGAMDDAAKAATGLAHATGKDAAASLGDLKSALEGNFDAFYQINPQIMYMRTNQEKLAAVMAIANQGLSDQAGDMNTVLGSGRRADSAITTLMETFGKIIAPIRVLINAGLQQLSESLTSVLAPAAEYATSILENIGPIVEWVKEKVVQAVNIMIGAFTFFETILTNLSSVWDMVSAYAELTMIRVIEAVKHAFLMQIPAYAKWFGVNFLNLMKDAFNGVVTIVYNATQKLGKMIGEVFAFIASGGEGGLSGLMENLGRAVSGSLLEGFQSSLTSLPEIAERQLTAREKDLGDKIGEIGGRLGQQFSDKMKERMVGVGSDVSDELKDATNNINLRARAAVITQGVAVTEGRLLTRGPGTRIPDLLTRIANTLDEIKKQKPLRLVPNV